MIKYGLFHKAKKVLLTVEVKSDSDSEFSCDVCHTLSSYEDDGSVWLVGSKTQAEQARVNQSAWYDAGYTRPCHSFEPEDLEVVEVELTFKVV